MRHHLVKRGPFRLLLLQHPFEEPLLIAGVKGDERAEREGGESSNKQHQANLLYTFSSPYRTRTNLLLLPINRRRQRIGRLRLLNVLVYLANGAALERNRPVQHVVQRNSHAP